MAGLTGTRAREATARGAVGHEGIARGLFVPASPRKRRVRVPRPRACRPASPSRPQARTLPRRAFSRSTVPNGRITNRATSHGAALEKHEAPSLRDPLTDHAPAHARPSATAFLITNLEYAQEPHAKRRREILAKHPEIKDLYGPDWTTAPQIFAVVAAQLGLAAYLGNHASTPVMLFCAYLFGGFATANLFLANHELSHNLAFASPSLNRALGLVANLPIGIPFSVAFKKYHLEHHMFQGHDNIDTDIPTRGEAKFFTLGGVFLKIVWVIGQLFFYAIRPLFVRPKPMGKWDALNLLTQLGFDLAFIKLAGARAFTYLLASVFLGGGLHPIAGHFISEHYVFEPGQETYSYYGPLNAFVYNVGYHNEHHDFPKVPGSRLHKIREIAPEYYNTLKYHTSWTKVIKDYILDPNMGPFSRTMRKKAE